MPICRDIIGWDMWIPRAAAENDPNSATRRKTRIARSTSSIDMSRHQSSVLFWAGTCFDKHALCRAV
ncbi:hypothetical protein GbCGDNIH4_8220 [Granulibacter bethesdensis CGDNIH4]|nr:hypothetical protein GbCGDNIH4_8220 [Granulibacter bethesdensis CGDNIH4]